MEPPSSLQKGIDALNKGRTRDARRHLGQYLREQPDDPRGWWLLAQAVESAEQKADCVQNVLRLQPNHAEAAALLGRLRGQVATPTPAEGVARPVLHAREDGTVDLPRPEFEEEEQRDLYVASAAVLIALLAIAGTVLLVASGSGSTFGFSPPNSTPTPILIGFGLPACTSGEADASIVFINNTALEVTVLRGTDEILFMLGPGEQDLAPVPGGAEVRYSLQTNNARYEGIPASIRVPEGNACRVPIQ